MLLCVFFLYVPITLLASNLWKEFCLLLHYILACVTFSAISCRDGIIWMSISMLRLLLSSFIDVRDICLQTAPWHINLTISSYLSGWFLARMQRLCICTLYKWCVLHPMLDHRRRTQLIGLNEPRKCFYLNQQRVTKDQHFGLNQPSIVLFTTHQVGFVPFWPTYFLTYGLVNTGQNTLTQMLGYPTIVIAFWEISV